jgi:hypothetical protein
MQEIFQVGPFLGDAANATDLSDLFESGAVPKKPLATGSRGPHGVRGKSDPTLTQVEQPLQPIATAPARTRLITSLMTFVLNPAFETETE